MILLPPSIYFPSLDTHDWLANRAGKMKPVGILKHFAFAFALAAVTYAAFYSCIEHRRVANGPWQVTFTGESGTPAIIVHQPALEIKNVRIAFPHGHADTNLIATLEFSQARPVPFDLPFGKCVFLDTVSLPGTAAFECFGHEIQLMPRVLTIDKVEHPWRSDETFTLAIEPPNHPESK